MKLKAQSPSPPEQHVLGGYTTWPARTAGLEVQAEPKIVATLLGALEEATGRTRRVMQDEHGPYARVILDAKPAAYWRLNEAAGKVAGNAVAGGPSAEISAGVALYLPGVGSGPGTGLRATLTSSTFSRAKQINRALHLAGGDVQADVEGLGERYSIALWFWLGEASGASERSGTLVVGPGGESLTSKQTKDHRAEVLLNGSASKPELRADDWHFAVLVRDGNEVRVHVDGSEQPGIVAASPAQPKGQHLRFGQGLQGKLDEVAVFKRALPPTEIAAFWKASGISEQRAKQAAERAKPPIFPADYATAISVPQPIALE